MLGFIGSRSGGDQPFGPPRRSEALRGRGPRVLLYSHDTFGLGHLRRSTAIAKTLVSEIPNLSALIVTGSPVAGRFALPPGVDFVRLPGVVKMPDGAYASQNLGLDIDAVTALRASVIDAAVAAFEPDLVIVDKEPTGFRGELAGTLDRLTGRRDTRVVLGLRDVLDAPEPLAEEWMRKGALAAAETHYHEIWVYGLEAVYEPMKGLNTSARLRRRVRYTGYLRREPEGDGGASTLETPYVLVTPGGGGDGAGLVDWALSAYEADPTLAPRAVIVYGPFLSGDERARFNARAEALGDRVEGLGFVSNMEAVVERSAGVVAMGGYNTFCEILSCDKPAVLAPRVFPRREQELRAEAAERLGLVRKLDRRGAAGEPSAMAAAIRALAAQAPPSAARVPGLLDGFGSIVARTRALLGEVAAARQDEAV